MSNAVLEKLANQQLKNVATGQMVTFSSLWQDKPCVIIFFRRWGCMFCRLWASEINEMADTLSQNNVRLVGVGADEIGLDDFVAGKFFKGELYVNVDKQAFKDLNYKRYNYLSVLAYLLTSESRTAASLGKEKKLGGDMRGDALQNGGALVVSGGGKEVLLNFKQEGAAEHLPNSRFLEVLSLCPSQPTPSQPQEFKQECN